MTAGYRAAMDDAAIADRADAPALAATLARAFAEDPGWLYLFPAVEGRLAGMTAMLRTMIERAYVGLGASWQLPGAQAAAVWMPPGQRHVPVLTQLAAAPRLAAILRSRTVRGLRTMAAMEKAAPKEPHYYLAFLGVEPSQQGRGLGVKILAPVLAECDRTRTLAWLETANPANHSFYRRMGFEESSTVQIGGATGPTLTFFARAPR